MATVVMVLWFASLFILAKLYSLTDKEQETYNTRNTLTSKSLIFLHRLFSFFRNITIYNMTTDHL
jgi:uncharacterized membrane protein